MFFCPLLYHSSLHKKTKKSSFTIFLCLISQKFWVWFHMGLARFPDASCLNSHQLREYTYFFGFVLTWRILYLFSNISGDCSGPELKIVNQKTHTFYIHFNNLSLNIFVRHKYTGMRDHGFNQETSKKNT